MMKGIAINKMVEMVIAVVVIGIASLLVIKYVNLKPVDIRLEQTKLCNEYIALNSKCDQNFVPPNQLKNKYEEIEKNLTSICNKLGYKTIKECCSC